MSEHTRMMVVGAMHTLQDLIDGKEVSSVNGAIGMAIDILKMAKEPPPWAESILPGCTKEKP